MHGPEPRGHWTGSLKSGAFQHLIPDERFEVCAPFRDYDGDGHAIGESWQFLAYSFLPHDDGLSLFVSLDGQSEWHIRLQWRPEAQGPIIDNLGLYLRPAG